MFTENYTSVFDLTVDPHCSFIVSGEGPLQVTCVITAQHLALVRRAAWRRPTDVSDMLFRRLGTVSK